MSAFVWSLWQRMGIWHQPNQTTIVLHAQLKNPMAWERKSNSSTPLLLKITICIAMLSTTTTIFATVLHHWKEPGLRSDRSIECLLFFLAIIEVNTYLYFRYFPWKTDRKLLTLHQFRRQLVEAMINNEYSREEKGTEALCRQSKRLKRSSEHELLTAPVHAKIFWVQVSGKQAKMNTLNSLATA